MMYAQSLFQEVDRLYTKALELDNESLEVKAQYAQLKSMMFGDLDGAVTLLKEALYIARTREEVQDILTVSLLPSLSSHLIAYPIDLLYATSQFLVSNEAQLAVVEEFKRLQA